MRGITAEAALLFFGENDVSFIVDNQLLAFGGDVGQDAVASGIISARCLIGSLPVVNSVIEHEAVKSVIMIGDGKSLVVGNSEGWTPKGRGRCGKLG